MAKHGRPQRAGKQKRTPAGESIPAELRQGLQAMQRIVRDHPEGWGAVAEMLKGRTAEDTEIFLRFLAQSLGKEALPLLQGAAHDEDPTLSRTALRVLPLLRSRAAGDVLAEIYASEPESERGQLAVEGMEGLRAYGINVPVPDRQERPPTWRVRETWETFPDGTGSRQTWALLQNQYGMWNGLALVWNDQAGVKDHLSRPMSRQEWKNLLEHLTQQGVVMVKVPADYARWQVERASQINGRTGFPLADHLELWRAEVGPAPEGYSPPDLIGTARSLPQEQREDLVAHSGCLFGHPAFRTWSVEPADVQPWFERWQATFDIAGDEEKDAAQEDVVREVIGSVITPELSELVRERLVDVTCKLAFMDQRHEAEVAAAAALEIEEKERPDAFVFQILISNAFDMLAEILADGQDPETLRYDPMQPVDEE